MTPFLGAIPFCVLLHDRNYLFYIVTLGDYLGQHSATIRIIQ